MSTMEFTLKLLELTLVDFSKIVAWPTACVLIGYIFKMELRDFISRTVEIGPKGAKAVPPMQHAPIQIKEIVERSTTPPQPLPPANEVLQEIENNIRAAATRLGYDTLAVEDQRARFIREYSVLALDAHYKSVGHDIFGTQIAALRHLQSGGTHSRDSVHAFYEEHVKRLGDRNIDPISFETWIGYLLQSKLVSYEDGRYTATPMGRQFLTEFAGPNRINEDTRLF